MKNTNCPREQEIAEAARSGAWSAALRAHAAGCAACGATAETASWMQTLARETETDGDAREASLIWWKAQLGEKLSRAERAQAVAAWIEIVFAALLVAGIAGGVAAGWESLQDAAAALWTSLAPLSWLPAGAALQSSSIFLWFFLAAVSVVALFIAYPMLMED